MKKNRIGFRTANHSQHLYLSDVRTDHKFQAVLYNERETHTQIQAYNLTFILHYIYLLIYDLFNDTVNSSDYIELNDRTINE
jgi:hypothetical protein